MGFLHGSGPGSGPERWLVAGLEATIAATIVLAAASALALAARRASAASRHAIWSLGLLGALLAPAASRVVPGWALAREAPAPAPATTIDTPEGPRTAATPARPAPRPEAARPSPGLPRVDRPSGEPASVPVPSTGPSGIGLGWWLAGTWVSGAVAVLARMAAGLVRLRRVGRRAIRVDSGGDLSGISGELSGLAGRMGIGRRVGLLVGPDDVMPMTWGWFRPVVLLPKSAGSWPIGRRRAVFLHELAHVLRWDCATQAMARVACALYWFHPLAWLAESRMRAERERACDDLVLLDGQRPSDYAGGLIDLARSCRAPRGVSDCATAMARPSMLEARVRAILDPTARRRGPTRRTVLLGLLALAMVTGPASALRLHARPRAQAGEAIAGRVLAREGNKPLAGAEVVAHIGAAEVTTRTDAEGRFEVPIPPDRSGDDSASVWVVVRHPGFIAKQGGHLSLAEFLGSRSRGEPSRFSAIRLDEGVEYTGEVVRPDGSPAAGLDLWFQNWGWNGNPRDEHFWAEDRTRTDAQGRFRLRMYKTQALEINTTPDDLAPLQRFLGHDRPSDAPGDFVPADLGRFALEDGIRPAGRLIDQEGRPIAGERVEIQGRIRRIKRTATTGPDGSFTFGPLRVGSYTAQAERQAVGGGIDIALPPLPAPPRAIRPVKVVLKAGEPPEPVELREVPSVAVTCRFVDSQGRPAKGGPVNLGGMVPVPGAKGDPDQLPGGNLASSVNEEEPEDTTTRLDWSVQAIPDAGGKITFHAPAGLRDTSIDTIDPYGRSLRTRLGEGKPLKFWGGGRLGELVEDVPDITFVSYRAPTVVATVDFEGNEPPEDLQVGESFVGPNGGSYGGTFDRLPDGRYRSRHLMPDHVYDITAGARGRQRGWLWTKVSGVTLPEGGYREVRLTLRKKPEAAKVGDLAPEPDVKGLDGRPFRLADYRGKFVLLDLWRMWEGPAEEDLPFLKLARARFADDPRFALVGLSAGPRKADAEKVAAREKVDWLRVVLEHEGGESPIPHLYGSALKSTVVLIGPDGRIMAMGLHGAEIDAEVARALGK